MKNLSLILLVLLSASLQAQDLPSESPRSKVTQKVGFGDIIISYSRPNAHGRKIFGGLVPFDSVWRTGANYPTFVHLSDTTYIENNTTALFPGKYALYTIPQKDKWTIIFSRDTTLWGSYGYQQKNDALRVEVPVSTTQPYTETFGIQFINVQDDETHVSLAWENTGVSFRMHVDIQQRVLERIERGIREKPEWSIYWSGASYLLEHNLDLNLALEWSERSIELYPWWGNLWVQAELYAALGNFEKAVESGEKALESGMTGENAPYFSYQLAYQEEIDKWKAKTKTGIK